jgi:hypothetical protein
MSTRDEALFKLEGALPRMGDAEVFELVRYAMELRVDGVALGEKKEKPKRDPRKET